MDKNILIIDDSESVRELVAQTLEEVGFQVLKGANGKEGLDLLKEHQTKINLIISDLNMPVMDGIEFVKGVRNIENTKFLPILILTTETQDIKRKEAKEAGATGWIVKPFDKNRLLAIINKVLR